MRHLIVVVSTMLVLNLELCYARKSKECDRCDGTYGEWNTWSNCGGGDCHKLDGIQTRSRPCIVSNDVTMCRSRESRPCVNQASCLGEWGRWSMWGGCIKVNESSTECQKQRYRWCQGMQDGQRSDIGYLMCYGGKEASEDTKECFEGPCSSTKVTSDVKPTVSGMENPKKMVPVRPKLYESTDGKKSGTGSRFEGRHTTLLIIGVGFGSLVVGGVVMLFAIRVKRHRAARRKYPRGSHRGRKNLLSVSFSTGTDATGSERFSPTTQGTVDGNGDFELLSRHDFNPSRPLGSSASSITNTPSTSGESSHSGVNSNLLQVPRENLHENVYWEINELKRASGTERPYSFADDRGPHTSNGVPIPMAHGAHGALQKHKIHRNRLNAQNLSPGDAKMVDNVLYKSIGT
ncbi:uncharacterized protein LOC100179829 [Ciona intestinalis]